MGGLVGQNVLWTLALGLCAMACSPAGAPEPGLPSLAWLSAAAAAACWELLNTDYGAFRGAPVPAILLHPRPAEEVLDLRGMFLWMCYAFQFVFLPGIPVNFWRPWGFLSFLCWRSASGRRSSRRPLGRYGFYWFYPLHMLLF